MGVSIRPSDFVDNGENVWRPRCEPASDETLDDLMPENSENNLKLPVLAIDK